MTEKVLNLPRLIEAAESVFRMEPGTLNTDQKDGIPLRARRIVCHLAADRLKMTPHQISRRLNRHASSIIFGLDRIAQQLPKDKQLQRDVAEIWKLASTPGPIPRGYQPVKIELGLPPAEKIAEVRKLRDKRYGALSVPQIARRTGLDEVTVARLCGVELWNGRPTNGFSLDRS